MSDTNEELAKLFFEELGFFVRTNVKYPFKKGDYSGDSDIDLLILNPIPVEKVELPFILEKNHISQIGKASVEVKGWHTEKFSPSYIRGRLLNFVSDAAIKVAEEAFGTKDFVRILVLPQLSKTAASLAKVEQLLTEHHVHVIEFHTIIQFLDERVNTRKSYQSEMLQMIRLIKLYS